MRRACGPGPGAGRIQPHALGLARRWVWGPEGPNGVRAGLQSAVSLPRFYTLLCLDGANAAAPARLATRSPHT